MTPNWADIDWCDRNVKAGALSDSALLEALHRVHPYSWTLIDLFEEANRRNLEAATAYARPALANVVPEISAAAANLLGRYGTPADATTLLTRAHEADDRYHRAALLEAAIQLAPHHARAAVDISELEPDVHVRACLVDALPADMPGLEELLSSWRAGAPAALQRIIQDRMAKLPPHERFSVREVDEHDPDASSPNTPRRTDD